MTTDPDVEWTGRIARGFTCVPCKGIGAVDIAHDMPDGSARRQTCLACEGTGREPDTTPTHLAPATIQRFLDRRATVGMPTASIHVYLRAGDTSWRPTGGAFAGPGVVHYWRFRDGGIGGVWVDTYSIAGVIDGSTG